MPPKKKVNNKPQNEEQNICQQNHQPLEQKIQKPQPTNQNQKNNENLIKIDNNTLSEQEKLKQRALKFGGSQETMSDLAKLNQFRLAKFGKLPPQLMQKETQKKQKNSKNSFLEDEDQKTLKARLEKFGGQNKKQNLFKKQQSQGISLDAEIQKSKKIYKNPKGPFKKHGYNNNYHGK